MVKSEYSYRVNKRITAPKAHNLTMIICRCDPVSWVRLLIIMKYKTLQITRCYHQSYAHIRWSSLHNWQPRDIPRWIWLSLVSLLNMHSQYTYESLITCGRIILLMSWISISLGYRHTWFWFCKNLVDSRVHWELHILFHVMPRHIYMVLYSIKFKSRLKYSIKLFYLIKNYKIKLSPYKLWWQKVSCETHDDII